MTTPPYAQDKAPHAPATAQAFAALITYRGPDVIARRVSFEAVNAAMTDLYARALSILAQEEGVHVDLNALWWDHLRAWFWRLESAFLRELWECSPGRVASLLAYGKRPDKEDIFADLFYARAILNLAILHDALSPDPQPTRPQPVLEQDDLATAQDDDPV